MVAHTIEAAREAGLFDRVVVSTECAEIAAVARQYGVTVSDRPAALARDDARVVDVCLDLLECEAGEGRSYELLCCLYATAPLRGAEDIRATVRLVEPGRCDFAMAVTDYDLPPHQALRVTESGTLEPMWPDLIARRSQEIGRLLVDNGSTYVAAVGAFCQYRTFYGPGLRGHVMPRNRSVDIDVADDLEMALYFAERLEP
jgi:CMP-N-acetylneuraminic acid synthetase